MEIESGMEIISKAVIIEKKILTDARPVKLLGMNCELMSQYIQFGADHLSNELGLIFFKKTKNPFSFMELISLEGKTNFFERKVGEYPSGMMSNRQDQVFILDAEFQH
jgi:ribonucleoside-diphosphate reductase subunit M2